MEAIKHNRTPLEQGHAYLSQFKEIAHDAKELIERLAEIQLDLDEHLKQKDFAERVGDLFSTENDFITQVDSLVDDYEIELNRQEQAEAA
ncbi:MAG: hypothetical protein ACI8UO_005465 [Verrucomicrobiales bacterium]|jgi:hypothetical protein